MLIIAHHFIQDPETFWGTPPTIPSHLKLHAVYPSKDGKTGTCVWEASGSDEVQQFLDSSLGHVSKNVCYEINESNAMGLPQKTMEKELA